MPATATNAKAHLAAIKALAEAIHDAGPQGIPSGTLYAAFMAHGISLESYNRLLDAIVRTGLVKVEPSHLVKWVG